MPTMGPCIYTFAHVTRLNRSVATRVGLSRSAPFPRLQGLARQRDNDGHASKEGPGRPTPREDGD
eukprot:2272430-Pyramimonas_sp.AAC.1